MTKVDKNGRPKRQTIHVAVAKTIVERIKKFAYLAQPPVSINAQTAWLIQLGLEHLEENYKESANGNAK